MSDNVVSLSAIKTACRDVLIRTSRPIHYKALTMQALEMLGIDVRQIALDAQIEDVREKVLDAGQLGMCYIGRPYCVGAMLRWFDTQAAIAEPVRIERGNITNEIETQYESLMRSPHMQTKTSMYNRARGLVIQGHVTNWFKAHWPTTYMPPENHQQWTRPCDHDFRINADGVAVRFDVSGPNYDGSYGTSNKRTTHYHLICDIAADQQAIEWLSVVKGEAFQHGITPELGIPPERMIVWLNCLSTPGLEYAAIKQAILERHGRRAA